MREDFLQDRRLEHEQLKSKATLDNLLPSHVSAALMDPEKKGQVFVQFEAEVSILFCDVMGFSDLVATVRVRERVRGVRCGCLPFGGGVLAWCARGAVWGRGGPRRGLC